MNFKPSKHKRRQRIHSTTAANPTTKTNQKGSCTKYSLSVVGPGGWVEGTSHPSSLSQNKNNEQIPETQKLAKKFHSCSYICHRQADRQMDGWKRITGIIVGRKIICVTLLGQIGSILKLQGKVRYWEYESKALQAMVWLVNFDKIFSVHGQDKQPSYPFRINN